MTRLADTAILIVSTHGFEQSEPEVPRDRPAETGAAVHIASPDGQPVKGRDKSDGGREADADLKIADVEIDDYDALVLPGGQINPDLLRVDADAMRIVRDFIASGKPVAAICHAPWLVIGACTVDGRRMTSYKSIATDMKNAGAYWRDECVVGDEGFMTSRNPADLDDFVTAIVDAVEAGTIHRRAI